MTKPSGICEYIYGDNISHMWRCVNQEPLPLPTPGSGELSHLFPTTGTESGAEIVQRRRTKTASETLQQLPKSGQYLSVFQLGRLTES
jgi:hypothetical protein